MDSRQISPKLEDQLAVAGSKRKAAIEAVIPHAYLDFNTASPEIKERLLAAHSTNPHAHTITWDAVGPHFNPIDLPSKPFAWRKENLKLSTFVISNSPEQN